MYNELKLIWNNYVFEKNPRSFMCVDSCSSEPDQPFYDILVVSPHKKQIHVHHSSNDFIHTNYNNPSGSSHI